MSQQQSFEQFLHSCDDPSAPPFSPIGNLIGPDVDLFQQFNQPSFGSNTTATTYWQPRLDDCSFENSQQDLLYTQVYLIFLIILWAEFVPLWTIFFNL